MKKEIKKNVGRRLKIIEGQIKGLQKMVDEDTYCVDIITQTSAVKNALSSVEDVMLKNHLETCIIKQIKSKNESKAVKEILDVYKLSKKK
ncbi:MAG: metal-sensitive transcriptional regulator [Nitrosopumilus sp.]